MKKVSLNSVARAHYGCPYDGLTPELQRKCKYLRDSVESGGVKKGPPPTIINPIGRKARRASLAMKRKEKV